MLSLLTIWASKSFLADSEWETQRIVEKIDISFSSTFEGHFLLIHQPEEKILDVCDEVWNESKSWWVTLFSLSLITSRYERMSSRATTEWWKILIELSLTDSRQQWKFNRKLFFSTLPVSESTVERQTFWHSIFSSSYPNRLIFHSIRELKLKFICATVNIPSFIRIDVAKLFRGEFVSSSVL